MPRAHPALRFAVITDIHYGFDAGNKLGSKAPEIMRAFEKAVGKYQPAFILDMGDRVSTRSAESDRLHMQNLMQHFNRMAAPTYHVAGNHDVHLLTRAENEIITGKSAESHSFDQDDHHIVVWNPHITRIGTGLLASAADLEWLQNDLRRNDKPTIVFSHAPLYQESNPQAPEPGHKVSIRFHHSESEKIRAILEETKNVRLCMNGHLHRNHHEEINGIHYIAQQSLVQTHQKKYRVPVRAWSWVEAGDDKITVKLQGKVRKDYVLSFAA